MNGLIKVGNENVSIKEFNGQRVVTFKDIDSVHERPDGTARKRFNDNKSRFVEGEDFYKVCPSEIRTHKIMDISEMAREDVTLLTESGYLMLVKSFTDDLAWSVQKELVKSYFKKKESVLMTTDQKIQLLAQGNVELNEKVDAINKDLQEFKEDMPLLALECQRITRAKNLKVVPLMGGKSAPAYKNKSLMHKVYSDVDSQLRRQFGVNTYKAIKRNQCDMAVKIIERYELPIYLKEEIDNENSQISLAI